MVVVAEEEAVAAEAEEMVAAEAELTLVEIVLAVVRDQRLPHLRTANISPRRPLQFSTMKRVNRSLNA